MQNPAKILVLLPALAAYLACQPVEAQTVRLPTTSANVQTGATTQPYVPPGGHGSLAPVPQPHAAYAQPYPGATLQAPAFDPYSTSPHGASAPPAFSPGGVPALPPPPIYGAPPPFETHPGAAFPGHPPAMFPDGMQMWGPNVVADAPPWGPPLRLFYGPRVRHTWLLGSDDPREMQWHKSDISFAVAFPNFLFTGQPVYILPAFALNLWDGPHFHPGADLPSKSYEAFVDVGWQSDPNQMLGLDLGVRVGVFTDFNTLTSDSIRTLGKGLLKYRATPTVTLKGGVYYIDRLDKKLLPAGGILWEPNPQMRFDIFFPEPKLATYLTTLGNFEVWSYVAGEYGGGSWTIRREAGFTDQIDLNDIRVMAGIEWARPDMIRQGRRIGFFEAGWVSNRELLYRSPTPDLRFRDTLMLRAGIGY